MAQLAPIVTLAATGASLYSAQQQAKRQKANSRIQQENVQAQQEAQQQLLATQAAADNAQRQRALTRTVASARARLGAAGVNPNEGSAAALTQGLHSAAAQAQEEDDATYAARLIGGRRSLLAADTSLQSWVSAGQGLGRAIKSLID
jgi:hypothetical protein